MASGESQSVSLSGGDVPNFNIIQLFKTLALFGAHRNNYDRTIAETEHAYSKILESSQTLLTVLKKESQTLGHG